MSKNLYYLTIIVAAIMMVLIICYWLSYIHWTLSLFALCIVVIGAVGTILDEMKS
jgi:hypothetical protein